MCGKLDTKSVISSFLTSLVAETTINRTDVKQMTHENFLAMLKGGKKDARVLEEFESTSNKGSIMTNSRDRSSGSEVAERIAGKSSSGSSGAAGGITWNALLDEYPLAGQSMALKVRNTCKTLHLGLRYCISLNFVTYSFFTNYVFPRLKTIPIYMHM